MGDGSLAMIVTIHPTMIDPLALDMTTMLIQEQLRKQEFSGFLAVNLFSSTKIKGTTQSLTGGSDDQNFAVIETCLAEKQLTEIIIGVGSILRTNELAKNQLETFYGLLSTKQKKQVNWNHTGENVLTGLLRCPECGAPMAASNVTNRLKDGTKKRIRYYSCSQFRNKGASVCHANSIRADQAEQFVAERLKEIVQHPQIIKEVIQALNQEMEEQRLPLTQELQIVQVQKQETIAKIEKWTLLLEDNPELVDSLKERLEELHTFRREKQLRENELLTILSYQGKKIEISNVTDIVNGIDKLVSNQEKQQIKQLYRTFIQKITFTPGTKDHLQLTMYFDQSIIDQLNKHYRETVSHSEDTVLFVLTTPFRFTV